MSQNFICQDAYAKIMISKIQKTWLWVFGAMFLIPEILWGNLIRIFKFSFLPIYRNVQYFTDNPIAAFIVIVVEIIGISGIIFLVNKKTNVNKIIKYTLNIILGIILLLLITSLYLSYVMTQVSFF